MQPGSIPVFDLGQFSAVDSRSTVSDFRLVRSNLMSNGGARMLSFVVTASDQCGNRSLATQHVSWTVSEEGLGVLPIDPVDLGCHPLVPGPDPSIVQPAGLNVTVGAITQSTNGCVVTRRVEYLVTDACNQTGSVTEVFTWIEPTSPQFVGTLPGDMQVECFPPDILPLRAHNGCGETVTVPLPEIRTEQDEVSCERRQIRVWHFDDRCGGSLVHTQIVTLLDTTPPTLSIPDDIDLGCNPVSIPIADPALASADDNCVLVELIASGTSSSNGSSRALAIVYLAIDDCGNTASATQTITWSVLEGDLALDPIPEQDLGCNPTLPPADPVVVRPPGLTVTVGDIIETTNECRVTRQVQYLATDACSRFGVVTQTLTWTEAQSVQFVGNLPGDLSAECELPSVPNLAVIDGCGNTLTLPAPTITPLNAPNCGHSEARVWTFSDPCGGSLSFTQIVTVLDTIPPSLEIPADQTLGCNPASLPDVDPANATASDNCVTPQVSVESQTLEIGSQRQMEIVYTATDACENTASATQTISWTVSEDALALDPIPEQDLGCNPQIPAPDPALVTPSGLTVTIGQITQSTNDCRVTRTVEFRATDACSRLGVVTQTLTWTEAQPIQFVGELPGDLSAECQLPPVPSLAVIDGCGNTVTLPAPTITPLNAPNCGRREARVWIFTDPCGGSLAHTQVVTLLDTTAPMLVVPGNEVLGCNPATLPSADPANATATDNCSTPVVAAESTLSEVGNQRRMEIVYSATDACGNQALATQVITWVDIDVPPVFAPIAPRDLGCNPVEIPQPGDVDLELPSPEIPVTLGRITQLTNGCNITRSVEYNASDECGQQGSVTQVFTWMEVNPLFFQGFPPEDRLLDCGVALSPPDLDALRIALAGTCQPISVTVQTNQTPGACPTQADVTYRYTASLACVPDLVYTQHIRFAAPPPPPVGEIAIRKTVYRGHNNGIGCPGGELATDVHGRAVTYCFEIQNTGPVALTDVSLSDDEINPAFAANIGFLAPGQTVTRFSETTVQGNLISTAYVSGRPADAEGLAIPDAALASASDTAEVQRRRFDLSIRQTIFGNRPVAVGRPLTFNVYVMNQGEVPARNIELINYIPFGFRLADSNWTLISPRRARYNFLLPRRLARGAGEELLQPGEETEVSITFIVEEEAAGRAITNLIEIASATDDTGTVVPDEDSVAGSGVTTGGDLIEDDVAPIEVDVLPPSVTLGEQVWIDNNFNGLQDADETGVGGVVVQAVLAANGMVFGTTTSNVDGAFVFLGLMRADYALQYDLSTLPDMLIPTTFSDGRSPATGMLEPGDSRLDLGLALWQPGSASGRVWNDLDMDGSIDGDNANTLGLAELAVSLYEIAADGSETLLDTTLSDTTGAYRFDRLRPGNYAVAVDTTILPAELTVEVTATRFDFSLGTAENRDDLHFGFAASPTAIGLEAFDASLVSNGVRITWTTAWESETLGFFVQRIDRFGHATRVNTQLILAKGGGQYELLDPGAPGGRYRLIEIETDLEIIEQELEVVAMLDAPPLDGVSTLTLVDKAPLDLIYTEARNGLLIGFDRPPQILDLTDPDYPLQLRPETLADGEWNRNVFRDSTESPDSSFAALETLRARPALGALNVDPNIQKGASSGGRSPGSSISERLTIRDTSCILWA